MSAGNAPSIEAQAQVGVLGAAILGVQVLVVPFDHAEGLGVAAGQAVPKSRGADVVAGGLHLLGDGLHGLAHLGVGDEQLFGQQAALLDILNGRAADHAAHLDLVQVAVGHVAADLLEGDHVVAVSHVERVFEIALADLVVLAGGDGRHDAAAGVTGEGRGEELDFPGGEALVHAHRLEEAVEGGGGGDQDHGLVAPLLEVFVGILEQLAGVALALHIGVGGQRIDVAHGDVGAIRQVNGAGQHGGHGVQLPHFIYHQDLLHGAELLIEDVDIGAGIAKAFAPKVLQLGQFFGNCGANGDHGDSSFSVFTGPPGSADRTVRYPSVLGREVKSQRISTALKLTSR